MPLVDITNDIKRSLKQNNQKNTNGGVPVVSAANQKSLLSVVVESPSHLKRISIAKTTTDETEDEEQQQPPTRARDSSRLSAGSGSSPFSKVSVEGPGEFLESEPSLSAKSSSDLSKNGNRRDSSGSEASVEQGEERRTEEEEEEKQPVVVQQLRQSRRQKHQPQRLGDLLEWNDIKSNALYEKYDPEKEQRLLEQVQMEKEKLRRIEEEEKSKSNSNISSSGSGRRASGGKKKLGAAVSASAASSSSSYQSGHQSQAVMEVHQRVADLMKMAEQMLPPEEEEEVDDGLPKKSIREKLRDAWDGDGYYAKLMKEQDGPSSSSSSSSSNGNSNNNNNNSSSNAIKKTATKANNNNGKKEGLKVYCDKENPVAHKVNRAKKAGGGLGGGGGLSSSGKLAVGCGNNATTIGGLANSASQPLVQRTALASALGNVTNNASSSSSSNNINNTISGTTYMFGNLKSIQAPSNLSSSSTHSLSSDRSTSTPPSSSSSSASAASSAKETNETLLALKAENDLLRKQRNDVKLQHLKLKKELDDLKKNARIAVSKLCAKLPNNSRGVELDALAFLKLN